MLLWYYLKNTRYFYIIWINVEKQNTIFKLCLFPLHELNSYGHITNFSMESFEYFECIKKTEYCELYIKTKFRQSFVCEVTTTDFQASAEIEGILDKHFRSGKLLISLLKKRCEVKSKQKCIGAYYSNTSNNCMVFGLYSLQTRTVCFLNVRKLISPQTLNPFSIMFFIWRNCIQKNVVDLNGELVKKTVQCSP